MFGFELVLHKTITNQSCNMYHKFELVPTTESASTEGREIILVDKENGSREGMITAPSTSLDDKKKKKVDEKIKWD
jgi:hypothetical protein